ESPEHPGCGQTPQVARDRRDLVPAHIQDESEGHLWRLVLAVTELSDQLVLVAERENVALAGGVGSENAREGLSQLIVDSPEKGDLCVHEPSLRSVRSRRSSNRFRRAGGAHGNRREHSRRSLRGS